MRLGTSAPKRLALSHRQEYRPNPTYGRNPRDSRGGGARGPGPREWGPRGSLTVHGGPGAPGLTPAGAVGPTLQPHPRPRRRGRREAARPRPDGCRRRPPARRSGGRERGGKGERRRRSTAHPGATAATEESAGAEGGGGAARVDGVNGVPAVGDRNGEVDEVDEDAANPKEAAPRWEAVRGDDGGGPELGGNGGERERRRELESGKEEGRREAETDGGDLRGQIRPFEREKEREKWGERERGSRGVISPTLLHAGMAGCGGFGGGGGPFCRRSGWSGGRTGMTGGPHPSARVAGGPARQRRARGERPSGPQGEEKEGEGDGPNSAH
uniref:Pr1-like protein n=1 Tax=Oryza sativa subsp. japonica TaxID=39947 RepID=Q5Z473_ORYSJ|nr:pr1-like protein [Oryza sativa Japonica Group]BAD62440.1 pr1-like protein [Oryza sativa Japonica Group]